MLESQRPRGTEKEENKKQGQERKTTTPERKVDLARDPGGVRGGGEGPRRHRTGGDRDRDVHPGDGQTDAQTERYRKGQRQRKDRTKEKT